MCTILSLVNNILKIYAFFSQVSMHNLLNIFINIWFTRLKKLALLLDALDTAHVETLQVFRGFSRLPCSANKSWNVRTALIPIHTGPKPRGNQSSNPWYSFGFKIIKTRGSYKPLLNQVHTLTGSLSTLYKCCAKETLSQIAG